MSEPETTAGFSTPSLPPGLEEGLALVLRAEEDGTPMPLARWLARQPHLAGELASFLAAQRDLRAAVPATAAKPSTVVGGFELREEIGRGAMGVVYRAYDPALKREVAVKLVSGGAPLGPQERARFRFEAEAAASLDDPAVVRVYAFGEADGVPYLIMPLLEGGSLARWLRRLGPDRLLPPERAAELVRDIARGVHHAHQRGLLHRDLKPGNILLDTAGRPHVADFGLARPLERAQSGSASGVIAGTVAYMAPEQAAGAKVLTTATDVHALGAILFELLTGAPPFGTGDVLATLRRVEGEPAPRVRLSRPEVPADLEAICARCLAKRPQDRCGSARELAEDLDRFLNGEPVHARQPGWLDRLGWVIDSRRERLPPASGPGYLLAGAWTLLTLGAAQAAVLAGLPGGWAFAALAINLAGLWVLYFAYVVARSTSLNAGERTSAALKLGALLAATALLPARAAAPGWDVLPVLQPLTAVFGLAVFVHGATHWGRMYLAGLVLLMVAAAMTLLPTTFWPAAFGLAWGGATIWCGLWIRRFERAAQPAAGAA